MHTIQAIGVQTDLSREEVVVMRLDFGLELGSLVRFDRVARGGRGIYPICDRLGNEDDAMPFTQNDVCSCMMSISLK